MIERLRLVSADDRSTQPRDRDRLARIAESHLPDALRALLPSELADSEGSLPSVRVRLDFDWRNQDDETVAWLWADRIVAALWTSPPEPVAPEREESRGGLFDEWNRVALPAIRHALGPWSISAEQEHRIATAMRERLLPLVHRGLALTELASLVRSSIVEVARENTDVAAEWERAILRRLDGEPARDEEELLRVLWVQALKPALLSDTGGAGSDSSAFTRLASRGATAVDHLLVTYAQAFPFLRKQERVWRLWEELREVRGGLDAARPESMPLELRDAGATRATLIVRLRDWLRGQPPSASGLTRVVRTAAARLEQEERDRSVEADEPATSVELSPRLDPLSRASIGEEVESDREPKTQSSAEPGASAQGIDHEGSSDRREEEEAVAEQGDVLDSSAVERGVEGPDRSNFEPGSHAEDLDGAALDRSIEPPTSGVAKTGADRENPSLGPGATEGRSERLSVQSKSESDRESEGSDHNSVTRASEASEDAREPLSKGHDDLLPRPETAGPAPKSPQAGGWGLGMESEVVAGTEPQIPFAPSTSPTQHRATPRSDEPLPTADTELASPAQADASSAQLGSRAPAAPDSAPLDPTAIPSSVQPEVPLAERAPDARSAKGRTEDPHPHQASPTPPKDAVLFRAGDEVLPLELDRTRRDLANDSRDAAVSDRSTEEEPLRFDRRSEVEAPSTSQDVSSVVRSGEDEQAAALGSERSSEEEHIRLDRRSDVDALHPSSDDVSSLTRSGEEEQAGKNDRLGVDFAEDPLRTGATKEQPVSPHHAPSSETHDGIEAPTQRDTSYDKSITPSTAPDTITPPTSSGAHELAEPSREHQRPTPDAGPREPALSPDLEWARRAAHRDVDSSNEPQSQAPAPASAALATLLEWLRRPAHGTFPLSSLATLTSEELAAVALHASRQLPLSSLENDEPRARAAEAWLASHRLPAVEDVTRALLENLAPAREVDTWRTTQAGGLARALPFFARAFADLEDELGIVERPDLAVRRRLVGHLCHLDAAASWYRDPMVRLLAGDDLSLPPIELPPDPVADAAAAKIARRVLDSLAHSVPALSALGHTGWQAMILIRAGAISPSRPEGRELRLLRVDLDVLLDQAGFPTGVVTLPSGDWAHLRLVDASQLETVE